MKRTTLFAVAMAALGFAGASHAIPFTVSSQLTGDPRASNPDGIVVDVTITGDTNSNQVQWLVDLNSPLHPTATLDVFAFNVLGPPLSLWASNFSPSGWFLTIGNNVPGSGGMDFRFESNDPAGPSNNVNNLTSLTFTLTNILRNFTADDFLDAPSTCSEALGCGQMGAHVRSLGPDGRLSGFALGDYDGPPTNVPEPATLSLFGLALLALGMRRKRV